MRVIFHSPSGERQEIGAEEGQSLMEAAKAAGIDGIDADCGGSMVCGTCHVHVLPNWFDQLEQPDEMESMILECVPDPHPRARLACQIPISAKYDGLEVMVPEIQR